jgi:hypothetical protein
MRGLELGARASSSSQRYMQPLRDARCAHARRRRRGAAADLKINRWNNEQPAKPGSTPRPFLKKLLLYLLPLTKSLSPAAG